MSETIRGVRLSVWAAPALAFALLLSSSIATAAATWWEVRDGPFHVVSTLRKSETTRIANDIKIYQIALAKFFPGGDIDPHVPVTILVLNESLWKKYITAARNKAGVAFTADDRVHIVVNGDVWIQASSVVYHELTHVFLHKNFRGSALPVWMEEGYADLMSTVQLKADHVDVGLPPVWRYFAMQGLPWMPLEQVLEVTRDSREYSAEKLAAAFYAQSWLIVHYQAFANRERGKQISTYVSLLSIGKSSRAAFDEAFPNDMGAFEQELRDYSRRRAFGYLRFPTPDIAKQDKKNVTELAPAAAREYLGYWMVRHSDLDAPTLEFLEDDAKGSAPTSAANLHLALAYLKKEQPELAEPRLTAGCSIPATSFNVAILCGTADSWKAESKLPAERDELILRAREYFEEGFRLAPGNVEALSEAASTYQHADGDSQSLRVELQKALAIDPNNPLLAISMATVLQYSDLPRTRDYLERAVLNVSNPGKVQSMLRWLSDVESQIAAGAK